MEEMLEVRSKSGGGEDHGGHSIPGEVLQIQVKVHGGRSERVKGQQAAAESQVAWIMLSAIT